MMLILRKQHAQDSIEGSDPFLAGIRDAGGIASGKISVGRRRCGKELAQRSISFSLVERNFNFAARALGWEFDIDGTAELVGNKIANEV